MEASVPSVVRLTCGPRGNSGMQLGVACRAHARMSERAAVAESGWERLEARALP